MTNFTKEKLKEKFTEFASKHEIFMNCKYSLAENLLRDAKAKQKKFKLSESDFAFLLTETSILTLSSVIFMMEEENIGKALDHVIEKIREQVSVARKAINKKSKSKSHEQT